MRKQKGIYFFVFHFLLIFLMKLDSFCNISDAGNIDDHILSDLINSFIKNSIMSKLLHD